VQVAHIRMGLPDAGDGWRDFGKAEKPHDFRTAPLCVRCHLDGPDAQHRSNEREWWIRLGVYPPAFCAELVRAFQAGRSGLEVVSLAAAGGFPWPSDALGA
jgi:hypothetical protein